MKFLFLLNSIVCLDDSHLEKLSEEVMLVQVDLGIATGRLLIETETFSNELIPMFKDSVEKKEQERIIGDFMKEIEISRSFETKLVNYVQNLSKTALDIANFDDPKTMSSATKSQFQETVRKFGDQISELEKLFKEGQTTEFSAKGVKIFKSKYGDNFKPDAIKKVEEFDKCLEKFNTAFKKFLTDGEKSHMELYKYVYNAVAEEAGISMSKTTKWILYSVLGVVCVVVIAVIGWFAYKTYKGHNSKSNEEDELQNSYIDQSHGHYNNHHSHYQDHQQHPYSEQPRVGQLENNRNHYIR